MEPMVGKSVTGWLTRQVIVVAALMRASLLVAMQYRSDFVFDGLMGLIRTAAIIAPLLLVFDHTDQVVGWTFAEATLVMSLYLMMQALIGGVVEPNLGEVVESVRTGTLDLVLMKPADAQLLVSFRRVAPAHLWDVVASLGLGGWAMSQLGTPSLIDIVVTGVCLMSGFAAVYGLWVLVICMSFFFVRVDNLKFLLGSVSSAGRWPLTVFTGWVRWALIVVVPVGLITSFPAMAITGAWGGELVIVSVGTGTMFALVSRWTWKRSLASYASASS